MNNKKLKNIAPKLSKLKKLGSGFDVPKGYFQTVENAVLKNINKPTFSVPEGYFDTVEDAVLEEINSETKVISFKRRFAEKFIYIAVAASILLFVTLQIFNSDEKDLFADVQISEIENWIENGDLELSSYEIAAVYEDIDLGTLDFSNLYSDDDLMDYLNEMDIESIILTN